MNRGGSWNNTPQNCRAAIRNNNGPTNRNNNIGFRLVLQHIRKPDGSDVQVSVLILSVSDGTKSGSGSRCAAAVLVAQGSRRFCHCFFTLPPQTTPSPHTPARRRRRLRCR
ncbi:MAG: hypothetical protein JNL02_13470 [Saprospiraceae bacterium]|nr:hypothetical protein [Saprospiraceae bacterium]